MKNIKNQTQKNEVANNFVHTVMNNVPRNMPSKIQYQAEHFTSGRMDDQFKIVRRRHSFDNNGGGYAGL